MDFKEKSLMEDILDMDSGYVSEFSNSTFKRFFAEYDVEIYSEKYANDGDSKARRMREFWNLESDYLVGSVLTDLINREQESNSNRTAFDPGGTKKKARDSKLIRAEAICNRLTSGQVNLNTIKKQADTFDAEHLKKQIKRIEQSIESDPELAIGTAKELVETTCKTILRECGKPVTGSPDISNLTKDTLKELRLVPEGISDEARGNKVIKKLLSNLGTIGNGLAELRGMYGTGHGKDGRSSSLEPRHARLAAGAATTLATFLFDTHQEIQKKNN